jgi:amidase
MTPSSKHVSITGALLLLVTASSGCGLAAIQLRQPAPLTIEEATIGQLHAAMKNGSLTCRGLVQHYLDRIAKHDKQGARLNAIIVVNPKALATADSLDRRMKSGGFVGPLHCVPTIVKDNYDTYDLPTTGGSKSLAGAQPEVDAPVVARMRAAGAIVLVKSNMAEFAFSPLETVSSMLGHTRNPFDTTRVPAGSSGGTAAAVSANFGAVGLGTDTGNSIRGPSSHTSLVGIRPTMGLVSRAGVIPLDLGRDMTGPMARTVEDAVAVLQVIAGPDPRDRITATSAGKVPANYATNLVRDGLRGARLGILRAAYETRTTDSEVVTIFRRAVEELRRAGAVVIDSIPLDAYTQARSNLPGGCSAFKFELNVYLAEHGTRVPVHTLDEVIASGGFDPSIAGRLRSAQGATAGLDSPGCAARDANRAKIGAGLAAVMDANRLDAFIYPTWSNPPRVIGELTSPAGDNNQVFSPSTGFPAITVPMGYTRGATLPIGLQFLGRAWDESRLIRLAYSYEQATKYRRPPPIVP